VQKKLKTFFQAPAIRHYLKRKYGWSDEVEAMVAWDAVQQAMKTKTISQKRAIVKMIHEWNQTN
jgi:hypothetical protein